MAEVHLLLENLSANPNKALSTAPAAEDGLPERWIEEICQLNWPPKGTREQLANEAALLMRAKDFLNRQAKPASGATIAFTLLVAQGKEEPDSGTVTSRSLARQAYPGLVRQARWFRYSMWALSSVLCVFLLMTCALSWYTAFGASTLAQRALAQADFTAAQKRVDEAQSGVSESDNSRAPSGQTQTIIRPALKASPSGYVLRFCQRSATLPRLDTNGVSLSQFYTVADIQVCDGWYKAQYNLASIDKVLITWLSAFGWLKWQVVVSAPPGENLAAPVLASTWLNILSGAILPVSYGVLGAAAAVVRSISRKFRDGRLSPRDMTLSLQQLAMGAVTGSCIGLFTAQPGSAGQATAGIISAAALTGPALSFVAGFGVEQVFSTLEMLIRRVFPGDAPSQESSPKQG